VSAACFEAPSAYEIMANGRKLLGSAQSRRATVVLQHGTLPLCGELTRLIECLALPSPAEREALRRSLTEHASTLEQLTGRRVTYAEAVEAMIAGFTSALELRLTPGDLNEAEMAWAIDLVCEKYGNREWTERA
jgi:lipoate-protein ligase A